MNANEERLIEALKTLAANETRGPSADLERRLLKQAAPRTRGWLLPAGIAALAAAAWVAALFRPVPVPATPVSEQPTMPLQATLSSSPQETFNPPVVRPIRPRVRRRAPVVQLPPLMRIPYADPLGPADRSELLRVSMPAAQLLSWGFPFSGSDPNVRVKAEVLVGEDGLARAVRLVR